MHLQHNFLVVRWPDTRFAALRKGTVLRVAGCDGNAQESLGTDSRDAMARSLDASLLESWGIGSRQVKHRKRRDNLRGRHRTIWDKYNGASEGIGCY